MGAYGRKAAMKRAYKKCSPNVKPKPKVINKYEI